MQFPAHHSSVPTMLRLSRLFFTMLFSLMLMGIGQAWAAPGHHTRPEPQTASEASHATHKAAVRAVTNQNERGYGHDDDCDGICASCCAMACGQTALNEAGVAFFRYPTVIASRIPVSLRGSGRIISPPLPPPRITA